MKIKQTKHDHRVVRVMPANLTMISNQTNHQQKHHYLWSGGDDHAGKPDINIKPIKNAIIYNQVGTIMLANLGILADVIRVVRTKLRRDQNHVKHDMPYDDTDQNQNTVKSNVFFNSC